MANGTGKLAWMTPSLVVQIIVWIFMIAFFITSTQAHIENKNVHMSYKEKVKEFVPRGEFDAMKHQLDRIEDKLDKQ